MSTPARTLALFISDLHLQESHAATADAFFSFLHEHAAHTRQLYLLGDIFEYWAGDDDLDTPFHARVVAALRTLADAGVELYWMAGNRDFLVGADFARAAGLTLLAEPHVVEVKGQRIALVHGDAECTLDANYMEFRKMVRNRAWQAQFLAMPLAQRKTIIAGLREGSREAHTTKSYDIMDVTPEAIETVFATTGADVLIHGHTHRPALHLHGSRRRYVLPDWESDATPARGGWIAVGIDGAITRRAVDGTPL
ncbi:UDP-2,3-diacylglucosamine diphosphatase [Massilia sp. Dwa41.01b]|uniref:UDP-2,3-diacylglucosamine diphosphatase n=1 Tax=unclassified Massilia TaxID=2609279 RepID=UPI0016046AE8|nr:MULTISPECIES: UDP-2,3-diacylglucosamine diphosphatase [unclassified Massilia]QNA88773.1 UDP-2,3-diacylglucosamine diphosphatase [Massilia sp. Dwa41.01b]QNA99676.1 UDP-2,3-diacylglucosamine diphosphatase [Massilia sp. Se16.2.3]